jgi:hypothetical protein
MPKLRNLVSALRGPVSERIRIRRSTVLLFVLFIGLGALWLGVRTEAATSSQGVIVEPKPGGGFTITRAPTTTVAKSVSTTTAPPVATTAPAPPTTVRPSPTTPVPPTTGPGVHAPATTTTTTTVASTPAGASGSSPG